MIDLHTHVLPALDDGPPSPAASLELCRAACAAGTQEIVATPHMNDQHPDVAPARIYAGVVALREAVYAAGIPLRIHAAAEFHQDRIDDLEDSALGDLTLGRSRHLLVEARSSGVGIERPLRELRRRGFAVLLAHPERYRSLQEVPEIACRLVEDGVALCVTASALNGRHGPAAETLAWWLLEHELVHVIASDAHDVRRRAPDLAPALERAGLLAAEIEHLCLRSPRALLGGERLPEPIAVRPRHGLRRRWRRSTSR